MSHRTRIAVALFLATVVFQSTFITLDAFVSDEGIVMVAADAVANGGLLYRDINVPLTPVAYLVQAAAFKIFGSSFLVSRTLICTTYAAIVVLVYLLALCLLPPRQAAIAGVLTIPLQVWMWPHAHYFSYNTLAILLCLVAIRVAWSIESGPQRLRNAFLFGAVLAAGLWTKPNLPVAIGAGVLCYWLSGWLRSALALPVSRPRGFMDLLTEGSATLAGIAVASLPMIGYLAATGTLDEMFRAVIAITRIYDDSPGDLFPPLLPPFGQVVSLRMSPELMLPGMLVKGADGLAANPAYQYLFGSSGWVDLFARIFYYTPVVLFLMVTVYLAQRLWRRHWSSEDEAAHLILFAGVFLTLTSVSFPAFHYVTPTLPPLVALSTFVAHRLDQSPSTWRRRLKRSVSHGIAAAYCVASFAAVLVYVNIPRSPVHTERGTLWVPVVTAHLWNEILDHARRELSADDRIFAVPYFPLFYFVTGQKPPSRYVALGPGLPGIEAEDEIILHLERDGVKYVLDMVGVQYRGIEGFQNSYPRLYGYLSSRYVLDREFEGPSGTYARYMKRLD